MAWGTVAAAAIPVIMEMMKKDSDASQLSGGQVKGQNQLLSILGRQGSDFNVDPSVFTGFGPGGKQTGGLTGEQYAQLSPQFAKAAAMKMLLGQGTSSVGVASAEQLESDKQQQEAAMAIASIMASLSQPKGNVDPGSSADSPPPRSWPPVQTGGSPFSGSA